MDGVVQIVINFVIEIVKFIILVVIWNYILFYIGFAILKIVTFLTYPKGMQLKK